VAGLRRAASVPPRSARWIAIVVYGLALAAAVAGATVDAAGAAARCPSSGVGDGYTARVTAALGSGRDVWGERLLSAPGGPTYAAAGRYLKPLLLALGAGGRRLTSTGVYYLPFGLPGGAGGTASVALHVADGSEIISRRIGGPTLELDVGGGGRELYGSCLARLTDVSLAEGYLPILETRYTDAEGARYRQESFAARVAGTSSLVSFVRVLVEARDAARDVKVRVTPSAERLRRVGDRLMKGRDTRLVASAGAHFAGSSVTFDVPRGSSRIAYAAWLVTPSPSTLETVTADTYETARGTVADYWRQRLDAAMTISVPEARVQNAWKALLVQELLVTWRYSVGNPYEEFSFPEGVDVAQVMTELGFTDVAAAILRTSLTRRSEPYANWKRGERLLASAELFRLSGDHAYLDEATPTLRRFASALGRQIESSRDGLLAPERYSSDIPDSVYGLHSQAVAWAGLRAMADAWDSTGRPELAATCRRLAARLRGALRRAVARSQTRLDDGSLFVPVQLLGDERPYAALTSARLGSYWNLVMPYALASGLFTPGGEQAKGVLDYMSRHGSRLLGLVRAGGYALYGRNAPPPISGTDQVYGNNVARFLADNDEADQLVLSLYGDLAAGMTENTFVSGEAASVAPLPGEKYRAMYLPPNGAANAAFLETLKLMLVHEVRKDDGSPAGLELAYAVPRAWLRPGKRVDVARAPTSFGPVSYTIDVGPSAARISVAVPSRVTPRTLRLRLRVPASTELRGVTLAGRPYRRFDRATGTIDLSGRRGSLDLVVALARSRPSP